jgi:hypothetical protein
MPHRVSAENAVCLMVGISNGNTLVLIGNGKKERRASAASRLRGPSVLWAPGWDKLERGHD